MGTFGPPKSPGIGNMSRNFNDTSLSRDGSVAKTNPVRYTTIRHTELEKAIFNWVCEMHYKRQWIYGYFTQKKFWKLAKVEKHHLWTKLSYSTFLFVGWKNIQEEVKIKKSHRSKSDSGDGESPAIADRINFIVPKFSDKLEQEVLKCEESGILWEMIPNKKWWTALYMDAKIRNWG